MDGGYLALQWNIKKNTSVLAGVDTSVLAGVDTSVLAALFDQDAAGRTDQ